MKLDQWTVRARNERLVPQGMKYCSRCEKDKPLTAFATDKARQYGVYVHCRECVKLDSQKYIEKRRRLNLYKNYGITPEEYDELLEQQHHVCAICGQPETTARDGKVFPLAVDHCHNSTKVRALLCTGCNVGLGGFRDDPEIMAKAIEYLRTHHPRQAPYPTINHGGGRVE